MIADKVFATAFCDTHEHLIEESERLAGPRPGDRIFPVDDWTYLVHHYASDDLRSAGMPPGALERFFSPDLGPEEKWKMAQPWWDLTRHTGYMRAAQISSLKLFGLPLSAQTVEEVTVRMRAAVAPGYYRRVLREVAKVTWCHVNSLRHTFCRTEQPDLLRQDLSILGFCMRFRRDWTFEEHLRDIDRHFEMHGCEAVAVKSQWAYQRPLRVAVVDQAQARRIYERDARTEQESVALQDYLFAYCVDRATDLGLPVKLHTGYYAGTGVMPLRRVRDNYPDLCEILARWPSTTFVLMHTGYPYGHEAVAVAKQFPNAVVDLCWAWIIDPVSTFEFVRSFFAAAPHGKLLCFGGDYYPVENVVGHAELARRGLASALQSLVDEGHLACADALDLVDDLMWRNAARIFPEPGRAPRRPASR